MLPGTSPGSHLPDVRQFDPQPQQKLASIQQGGGRNAVRLSCCRPDLHSLLLRDQQPAQLGAPLAW